VAVACARLGQKDDPRALFALFALLIGWSFKVNA